MKTFRLAILLTTTVVLSSCGPNGLHLGFPSAFDPKGTPKGGNSFPTVTATYRNQCSSQTTLYIYFKEGKAGDTFNCQDMQSQGSVAYGSSISVIVHNGNIGKVHFSIHANDPCNDIKSQQTIDPLNATSQIAYFDICP